MVNYTSYYNYYIVILVGEEQVGVGVITLTPRIVIKLLVYT